MRLAVSENSWTELSVPLFACSKKGIHFLKTYRYDLLCDTNVIKDPAGKRHFRARDHILLRSRKDFKLTIGSRISKSDRSEWPDLSTPL